MNRLIYCIFAVLTLAALLFYPGLQGKVIASITINTPTAASTYSTSASSLTIGGISSASYDRLVWDNVTKGEAGVGTINQNSFATGTINLKPGKNEILLTATTPQGVVSTTRIIVERTTSGPVISGVTAGPASVKLYEKYEINFNLSTAADFPMFMYDTNLPVNTSYQGVTVEAVVVTPSGKTLTQPAFYNQKTTKQSGIFVHTGQDGWVARISPQEVGTYQVSLRARDKYGVVTANVGSFQAVAGTRPGFIGVAKSDPRYFEYSNGTLHWPIGMTYGKLNTVLNYDRPWLGGWGIYTTRWARWLASNNDWGNEGAEAPLNYSEHYPSSELSYDLYYPQRYRIWISDWSEHGTPVEAVFKTNTTYQIKLRLKTQNLSGPRVAGNPWGLAVKLNGWLSHQEPLTNVENQLRNNFALVPHVNTNADWHTKYFTVTTPSSLPGNNINIYLDNVSSGQVYIDEFSVKPVLSGGVLGGELVRFPKADMHTYAESRPAAYLDEYLTQAEQNEVNLRFVVHDKNDLIQNHLLTNGNFVPGGLDAGNGYYQSENTKATWLLKQWWRYLVARYGYSTSVFGWELNNEGSPDDTNHYRNTQIFASWTKSLDMHPHIANTSFWCCWRPNFWKNNTQYPDVSFADIHTYGNPTDMVTWYLTESRAAYKDNVGKPIVRGETGTINEAYKNNAVWYHNTLWPQLDYSSMFEIGYWYSEHAAGIDRELHAKIFYDFVKNLPLNHGGYVDIAASTSNNNLQILGQKNTVLKAAHFWARNVNSKYTAGLPSGQSGTVTVVLNPNTTYTLETWNTWQANSVATSQVTSNAQGQVSINIDNLQRDLAYKLFTNTSPQPTITPAPSPTPTTNTCPADITGDRFIDLSDFGIIFANFGKSNPTNPKADINGDGIVDLSDFSPVYTNFGKSCN